MDIIGYLASALIGISLGLLGSGGSILTMPVLVYLFGVEPIQATAYSLFIVGITALTGAIRSSLDGGIDVKRAAVFAIPSLVAVYLTRRLLIPLIPVHLFTVYHYPVTRERGLMVLFGLLMLLASGAMIRTGKLPPPQENTQPCNCPMIALDGAAVGMVTGTVGAGGGFLIVPALVLLAKVPMKKAVGTSLLVIAANSLIGFIGDVGTGRAIDFPLVTGLSALSISGIFIGTYLAQFMDGPKLKGFSGWFVLLMGLCIVGKELFG